MKILIMAFPRSGTSLTYKIFNKHSDVKRGYFERLMLWRHNENYLEKYGGFKKGVCCVEKIIYEKSFIGKTNEFSYIDYCDLWNKRFGKEARIIQIVRHPYDQWNSIILTKYQNRKIPHSIIPNLKKYFQCVPEYTQRIMNYKNCLSFKYETLTENPENTINRLYNFCNLDSNKSNFNGKVRSKRTFFYKTIGHRIDNDPKLKKYRKEFWEIMNENIKSVLDVYNKIPGPKYEA